MKSRPHNRFWFATQLTNDEEVFFGAVPSLILGWCLLSNTPVYYRQAHLLTLAVLFLFNIDLLIGPLSKAEARRDVHASVSLCAKPCWRSLKLWRPHKFVEDSVSFRKTEHPICKLFSFCSFSFPSSGVWVSAGGPGGGGGSSKFLLGFQAWDLR